MGCANTEFLVLGFDGGGTKCQAALVDRQGRILGLGHGGPAVDWYSDRETVRASVREAVEGAGALGGAGVPAVVCACPGKGWAAQELRALLPGASVRSAHEADLIRATYLAEAGVVVLAGTGSFVHASDGRGRSAFMGGGGPLLGDEGSAYHIGLAGLRAAYRARYSSQRATTLADAVLSAIGLSEPLDLVSFLYDRPASRSEIAALARVVDAEANAGDSVARKLTETAAAELGALALEAMGEAGMLHGMGPLIMAGGVALGSALYREALTAQVRKCAPQVRVLVAELPPAVGGAFLALRDTGRDWNADLVANALQTCPRSP